MEVQDEFNDNLLYENTLERSNNPQGEDCKKCLDKNKLFSIINVKLEDQKHLCLVEEVRNVSECTDLKVIKIILFKIRNIQLVSSTEITNL